MRHTAVRAQSTGGTKPLVKSVTSAMRPGNDIEPENGSGLWRRTALQGQDGRRCGSRCAVDLSQAHAGRARDLAVAGFATKLADQLVDLS